MRIFTKMAQWQQARDNDYPGASIGFVPTMGALHDGHLSLVERCHVENDITVVSIFLNPTQFNNTNDLNNYPRDIDRDQQLLKTAGVSALLLPEYDQIYPDRYRFKVMETEFSTRLCGASRPGHFDGVLTVVMKLLNMVRADRAYFGEKDYQQYLLIRDMARAFFLPTAIIPCPTVREADGLAASSRNQILTPAERQLAPKFYRHLRTSLTAEVAAESLKDNGFEIDYITDIDGRRFGAVYLGDVRLIDNIALEEIAT